MNKDSSDFMLTEYERISTAFFGLRDQVNDWFKAYLTLIGFPLTVLAAALKIGTGNISASLTELPDIVSALLMLVSILGFFVTVSIISMRMEMILYARTINIVRRFFGDNDKKLVNFLILPTSDRMPPFYEAGRAIYWQIVFMGLLDGIILGLGVNNLFKTDWITSLIAGTGFVIIHLVVYRLFASIREKQWKVRFTNNLIPPQL